MKQKLHKEYWGILSKQPKQTPPLIPEKNKIGFKTTPLLSYKPRPLLREKSENPPILGKFRKLKPSLYMERGEESCYVYCFNTFQSIVPFLPPPRTFSGKTEKGNNILKWVKEKI